MNTEHIKGMVVRNLYIWVRDLDRVFDAFWWAFFDVVVWGFMSTYFSQNAGGPGFVGRMLSGIIFWAVIARSQWEISSSMLIESWEKNLINIFVSPITFAEYIFSSVLLGAGKTILVFLFMAWVTAIFYQLNIFVMSWWIVPLLANLFITSIWLAFIINALILRYGKRVMSFAWTLSLLINPVSGVVYPISALPKALQNIAQLVPTSYIFEGMRSLLTFGILDPTLLIKSFGLNLIYLLGSILFYAHIFKKARQHGWLIKLV